jgi:DNA-binding CsgD family transcriptional regulator
LKKIPVLLLLVLLRVAAIAQPIHALGNNPSAAIINYAVLPDHGYSFKAICTDTTLPFIVNDSLRPRQSTGYWFKMVIDNPFKEARHCQVRLFPGMHNSLYYYDAYAQTWLNEQADMMPGFDYGCINLKGMTCVLRAQTENTIYVHIDLKHLGPFNYSFKPDISIEAADYANKQEQVIWITWITSMMILLLFLLNNIYIYFSFKDKTVLYYCIGQLGGMIYVTAHKQIFPVFFPNPVFSTGLHPNGMAAWYSLNDLLLHIGVMAVLYCTVQFSRAYLNTRQSLPLPDAILRWGMKIYLLLSFILMIINTGFFYIEQHAWMLDNTLPFLIYVTILYTSVAGFRHHLPAARPFLIANVIVVGSMLSIPLYHLLTDLNGMSNPFVRSLLTDLVSITQTFLFSVALVARTRLMQKELLTKERAARQLEAELQELGSKHQVIIQKNQEIVTGMGYEISRNKQLQDKLEANQRELASSTLYIAQKNELLAKLKTQIKELNNLYPENKHQGLQDIESTLQSNLYLDGDWSKFKLHFEQVHPHFFKNLQASHPYLTKNEVRLSAYLHMNLSTKEISTLLNITPASVRQAKSRLYKRMGINSDGKPSDDEDQA